MLNTPAASTKTSAGSNPVGVTNEAGLLEVRIDAARGATLSLRAEDGRWLKSQVHAGAPADPNKPKQLTLPPRMAMAGRLIDTESRRAVEGGFVWDAANPIDGAVTDGSGGFALMGPAGHRLDVSFNHLRPRGHASRPGGVALLGVEDRIVTQLRP